MKKLVKFVNEINGAEFLDKKEALISEERSKGIIGIFSFWKIVEKDKGCDFLNGGWCQQRTREEYIKLQDAIIEAVSKYEGWILKHYEKHGGLKREYTTGLLGRFLDDSHSELYNYYCILTNICPVCYREWGQAYYANHCNHTAKSKEVQERY